MNGRIIAVNRFYAPDHSATAQLLTDLAEHLASLGTPVTVITSRLTYDDPSATLPACEIITGVASAPIRIRRVWTTRFGRAGLWGRGLDYATFYLSATLALLAEARPGDTILAKTDPPLMSIPAALVCRLKRALLVNWCQDLFPETAASLGLRWAGGPLGQALRELRNWSLRQAQVNVVLCEAMRSHLASQGVPKDRLRVIHNWPDPAIRPLPRSRCSTAPMPSSRRPFTICYSGNLGRAHNVDAIIDLIERTADIRDVLWRFVGGGAGIATLRRHVQDRRIGTVAFEGYAPRAELSLSLARADAHLVTLDPACEGLIMPSKLYGILAAGRPVLFLGAADGAVATAVAEAEAGLTLAVDRPAGWRGILQALLADPERLARMGQNARAACEQRYARDHHALASWRDVLAPAGAERAGTDAEPVESKVKRERKRAAA